MSYRKIKSLLDKGKTIILVSHDMLAVKNLCSFTHLLDKGTLVASGEPTDI